MPYGLKITHNGGYTVLDTKKVTGPRGGRKGWRPVTLIHDGGAEATMDSGGRRRWMNSAGCYAPVDCG
jgi:hypothetical protein